MERIAKNGPDLSPAMRQLVASVGENVRRMGAQSVITSQVIAERFGLHTTDLECLDLITMRHQLSAGELAAATGLTTGAMTALIDRLELSGYVERVADQRDRRRVQVRIRLDAIAPIVAVYEPMQARMFELWSREYSAKELSVIADFLSRGTDLAAECVQEIHSSAPPVSTKRRAPRSRTRIS